jgi:hypothetical protein
MFLLLVFFLLLLSQIWIYRVLHVSFHLE